METHFARDHVERFHREGDVRRKHDVARVGDVRLFVNSLADAVAQKLDCGLNAALATCRNVSLIKLSDWRSGLQESFANLARTNELGPYHLLALGRLTGDRRTGHV